MIRVGHDIEFFSRAGKPFHCFEHMKDELRSQFHSEVFLDGEMISSSFNKVVSSVHRKNYSFTDGIFSVFDILTPQTRNMTLSDRRKVLETIKENDHLVVTPQQVMYSVEDISEFYAECLQNGYEGVIIKDPHSLYEDRRSFSWMKIKPKATVDVSIIGTYEGTGKNLGRLGGFFCSTDGSEEVHRVGSGFTDEQRIEFWEASLTGRIIEIEVQEKLTTGGFRHSRFKRFRDTLTQCKE